MFEELQEEARRGLSSIVRELREIKEEIKKLNKEKKFDFDEYLRDNISKSTSNTSIK
jgi:hypothetical protein